MLKKFQSKSWYPYAVALCIAVVLYVVLSNFHIITDGLDYFGKYFNTVLIGCIIAYLMNPLAKLYERKLFRNLSKGRWALSIFLAFITFAAVIVLLLLILIPQLVSNITSFLKQLPEYQVYIHSLFQKLGITRFLYIPESADEITSQLIDRLNGYGQDIIAFWSGVLSILINLIIGAVLAVYLLGSKERLKTDAKELLSALLPDDKRDGVLHYIKRCDFILNRYLVFTLLDSAIIGVLNAAIMMALGMPYVGLISIVVGFTNLIPTFGPVIGAAVGGLILLLENPITAIIFVIANQALQGCDGYIIKPRLFGNSLGVSGLLILLAIVTLGNAFGVGGLLLAIPFAAVCDFTYREELLPYLKRRKCNNETERNQLP